MAEYLGLAMDIGAYLLFSRLETQLKANLYEIRDNVPVFHSHAALKVLRITTIITMIIITIITLTMK